MDEFLSEQEQIEQIRGWWSKNRNYVYIAILFCAAVVFGNNTCPYCRKTKNLLKKKKKKFIYRTFSSIDGSVKSILDDFLNIITNDYKYVPVIFHNGIFIEDGYSNLVNVI